MKLYLARHGRTNYNDLGLLNSNPAVDVHLTEEGVKQANALAQKLKDVKLDHVFVSHLKRTQRTAEIINQLHNAPVDIDERLDDIRAGFEDKPVKEFFAALDAAPDKYNAHFNGGESIEDVKKRAKSFVDEIKGKPYQTVLVVTSKAVAQMIYAVAKDLPTSEGWKLEVDPGTCLDLDLA